MPWAVRVCRYCFDDEQCREIDEVLQFCFHLRFSCLVLYSFLFSRLFCLSLSNCLVIYLCAFSATVSCLMVTNDGFCLIRSHNWLRPTRISSSIKRKGSCKVLVLYKTLLDSFVVRYFRNECGIFETYVSVLFFYGLFCLFSILQRRQAL